MQLDVDDTLAGLEAMVAVDQHCDGPGETEQHTAQCSLEPSSPSGPRTALAFRRSSVPALKAGVRVPSSAPEEYAEMLQIAANQRKAVLDRATHVSSVRLLLNRSNARFCVHEQL